MARGNKAIRNNGVTLMCQDVVGNYAFGDSERLPLKLGSPVLCNLLFCFSGLQSIATHGTNEDDFSRHEKAWWDIIMKFSKDKNGLQEIDQAKQSFARSALKAGLALEA